MVKVVPAIIPKSFDELEDKIDVVSDFVDTVQIDISNGEFAESITWPYTEGEEFPSHDFSYAESLNLEIDLFVSNPEEVTEAWIEAGAKTIILHLETIDEPAELITDLKSKDIKVGLSINPSTKSSLLDKWIEAVDFVQLMGNDKVGYSEVELDESVYGKIKNLHKKYPKLEIAVDIGVTFETAPKLVKAGATKLVSGSTIYKSLNVEEAITKLEAS